MTAMVSKAYPEDFERVFPLLEKFENPDFSKDRWKKLFCKYWESGEDNIGYVMSDVDIVVGFIGTIFSARIINGKHEKICNLSSWIVLPEYRSQSLLLFNDILKNKEISVTSFTSIPAAIKILSRLGFKTLDTCYYWYWNNKLVGKNKIQYTSDPLEFEKLLSVEQLKIYHNHLPFNASHFVFTDSKDSCYTIFRVKNTTLRTLLSNRFVNYMNFVLRKTLGVNFLGRNTRVARAMYISNTAFFNKFIYRINNVVAKELNVSGVTMDARFCSGSKKLFRYKSCPYISLFHSLRLSPAELDGLYSELFILDM
jgi:hypothetical protein